MAASAATATSAITTRSHEAPPSDCSSRWSAGQGIPSGREAFEQLPLGDWVGSLLRQVRRLAHFTASFDIRAAMTASRPRAACW